MHILNKLYSYELLSYILQIIDLNESNMWYLTLIMLLTILVIIITIMRFDNRRKRMLADRISGPDGSFLIGLLPLFLQGPEKLVTNGLKVYRM